MFDNIYNTNITVVQNGLVSFFADMKYKHHIVISKQTVYIMYGSIEVAKLCKLNHLHKNVHVKFKN